MTFLGRDGGYRVPLANVYGSAGGGEGILGGDFPCGLLYSLTALWMNGRLFRSQLGMTDISLPTGGRSSPGITLPQVSYMAGTMLCLIALSDALWPHSSLTRERSWSCFLVRMR